GADDRARHPRSHDRPARGADHRDPRRRDHRRPPERRDRRERRRVNLANAAYALRNAIGSLWAYRLRTSLTAIGVMMGVATVIPFLSTTEALTVSFKEQISLMATGTLNISNTPWITLNDWWRYYGRPPVTKKDADHLEERMTRALAVVPFADARAS